MPGKLEVEHFPTRVMGGMSIRGNNPEVFITRSHVSVFLISILRLPGGGSGTIM